MSQTRLIVILAGLVCLVAPAAALAQDAEAPPGLSGADEYLETVPDAGGNGTVNNGRRPSRDDPTVAAATRAAVPAATIRALERQGQSGADAAALAGRSAPAAPAASRPDSSGPSRLADRSRPALPRVPLKDPASSGPLAAAGRIATGGTGIGVLFPLLIVAGTLTVAGAALWRRRAKTE